MEAEHLSGAPKSAKMQLPNIMLHQRASHKQFRGERKVVLAKPKQRRANWLRFLSRTQLMGNRRQVIP